MVACKLPFKVNQLTKLWCMLDVNIALVASFTKYIKLTHITMVYVLDSVEDERCFYHLPS
jgi:hypothetical protein